MSAAWAVWAWLSSCCCPPVVCPQLYELDADPKRKEFLDDLFSFMQKRGEHSQGEGAALQILQLAPALPPPPSHSPGGWDRLGLGHYSLHVLGEETEAQGGSGLQPCSRKGAEGPKASLGPSLGPSFCKHMLAGLPTGRQRRGTVAS